MTKFLRIEEVIYFHDWLIEKYGGLPGIRDLGLLASAIAIAQQSYMGEELHRTLWEKAAAYFFHIIKNHPFLDGNKRTGVFVCLIFLERNNVTINFDENILEELAVSIASNKISKTELAIILEKNH